MTQEVWHVFRRFLTLLFFAYFLLTAANTYARPLPFNVVPKAGTTLPSTLISGSTATAYYTVTNNTLEARADNFIKYLPPNVSQVTTGGTYPDTCGETFNLAPSGQAGDSCTLQLTISGAVNANDPNPENHLFACFPEGITCAGTKSPLNVTVITLTAVEITPVTATINATQTVQYTANAVYSDGSRIDVTTAASWQSTNPSVATIGLHTGLATGVSGGTTTITANYNGIFSNQATLTVNKTLVSIAVTPPNATIGQGQTQQYTATGTYSDGSTADITATVIWNSSNTSVATISAGLANAVGVGTTNITATKDAITSNIAILNVNKVLVSIAVTPTSATIHKTATQQYTATGHYSDSSTADLTAFVTWASSNTNVATIIPSGLATGTGVGNTAITATQGAVTSNAATLIVDNPLQSITVTPTAATINQNQSQQYTATGTFFDGSTSDITNSVSWHSSDLTVATISGTGLATGVGVGTSNITATSGATTSNTAVLTVNKILTSIAVTPTSANIHKTQTQQFTATGHYSDSSTADITTAATWSSNNTSVATVGTNSGLATGVNTGTALITASQGTITSNSASLAVDNPLQSIAITPTSPTIATGQTQQFTATGTYFDNSTQNITTTVTWNSGTTSVATITSGASGGLASAVGPGTTNITATLSSVTSNTAVLTVNSLLFVVNDNTTVSFCSIGSSGSFACLQNSLVTHPHAIALNLNGTFAYVVSETDNKIYVCVVSNTNGFSSCTQTATTTTFTTPISVAVNPADTFAYIGDSTGVYRCAIDNSTGALSACSKTDAGITSASGIAINPAGTVAYVVKASPATVTFCTIDPSTGALFPCASTGTGFAYTAPEGVAVNRAGTFAYISDGGASVVYCVVNPSTGALSSCTATTPSGSGFDFPEGIAINFSDSFAYVANFGGNTVNYCSISSGNFSNCTAVADNFTVPSGVAIN